MSGQLYDDLQVRFEAIPSEYFVSTRDALAASLKPLVTAGEITSRDADGIAVRIAAYLGISTFGDIAVYRAYAAEAGRDAILPTNLTPETDGPYWVLRTAWAKQQPINFESASCQMLFTHGRPRNEFTSFAGGPIRPLRSGGGLFSGNVRCSVVEVTTPADLITIDGKQTVPAQIGFLIANDGPEGAWDTHMVFTRGTPEGVIVAMPPP
jgi:hypothetical protein